MTPRERHLADIDLIALRHGLTQDDVVGNNRARNVVNARRDVVMHFMKAGKSFSEIGRIIDRHHTTVMYLAYGKAWKHLGRSAVGEAA